MYLGRGPYRDSTAIAEAKRPMNLKSAWRVVRINVARYIWGRRGTFRSSVLHGLVSFSGRQLLDFVPQTGSLESFKKRKDG